MKINLKLMQFPTKTYELNEYKFSNQVFSNIRQEIKNYLKVTNMRLSLQN